MVAIVAETYTAYIFSEQLQQVSAKWLHTCKVGSAITQKMANQTELTISSDADF
jgi:hypothetical protein